MRARTRALIGVIAVVIATAIWIPSLHLFFAKGTRELVADGDASPPPARARALAARHVSLYTDPALKAKELARMRDTNAEWDFMGRSFLVWALVEMGLRDAAAKRTYLAVVDAIIDETLDLEAKHGMHHFLMRYSTHKPFVEQPAKSLFVDGEIALMLGMRRLLEEKNEYKWLLAERVSTIAERMQRGPVASAESYPDECWTFCNAVALAAVRVADALDETDHSELSRRWVAAAQSKLIDAKSGLLVSRYSLRGDVMEGPEGSSIWMVVHALSLVDEAFARDQYERAKKALARTAFGFGWALEWPASREGHVDVDSGPIVPLVGASAGSSGLALVASASFGDRDYQRALVGTLDFAAFPSESGGKLAYSASNQVGDAVLLYASVLGPAWRRVRALEAKTK